MRPHVAMMLPSLRSGGMESVVVGLIHGLADSFRLSVLCFDGLGPLQDRIPAGVDVTLLPRRAGRDWRFLGSVRRWLRDRSVDVLHAHNPTALFYGGAAALGLRTRVVYTDHGRAEPLRERSCWAIRRIARRVDHAVAVAPHILETLTDRYGFRAHQVRCIPNGVHTDPHPRGDDALPTGLGDGPRIGSVGRLVAGKDQHVLIMAVARLLPSHPGLRLDLIGDGPLRPELGRIAEEAGVMSSLCFHGECADVPSRLRTLDVFVHASRSEGMPMVVLEAMAAGLPLICSDIPGHRGVLGDPPCGALFPVGDVDELAGALAEMLSDTRRAETLASAAAAHCREKFSARAMIDTYEHLFNCVVEASR